MTAEPVAGVRLPPNIPGYTILEPIGEGGMGCVYRGVQLSLQRPVAIKVLRGALATPQQRADLERECRTLAAVTHPHVVAIYDSGQVDGQPFLVMEYIAGQSLRPQMTRGKPWPTAEALLLLRGVAEALSCIHSKGILHLDLKPENVLLTSKGTPKLTDFGLATRCQPAALVDKGEAQGTIDYASPEQRHGLPLDARSDLFSLATLAYELLTGRLPGRVFVPATQYNPQLPPAVDQVLKQGLARDPAERPATVERFMQDLTTALTPSAPPPPAGPPRSLGVLLLFLTALALLALAVGGLGRLFWGGRSPSLSLPVPAASQSVSVLSPHCLPRPVLLRARVALVARESCS